MLRVITVQFARPISLMLQLSGNNKFSMRDLRAFIGQLNTVAKVCPLHITRRG
jgi:hypothetical protein